MRSLNFVGGEKGGVGKSVLSRVLAQYFIDKQAPFVAYDTDRSHQSLRRFYADYASAVVIDSYEGLDQIAETLAEHEDQSALVDLAAQTFAPLKNWIKDSDLLPILDELEIPVTFWHVLDGSAESVALLDTLLDTFGEGPQYVVVLNHGRASDFSLFDESEARQRAEELGALTLSLPKLHDAAMRKIDGNSSSFWAAVNLKNSDANALGMLERQRVRVWLQKIYSALDAVYQQS